MYECVCWGVWVCSFVWCSFLVREWRCVGVYGCVSACVAVYCFVSACVEIYWYVSACV